jgi:hypothetical protein
LLIGVCEIISFFYNSYVLFHLFSFTTISLLPNFFVNFSENFIEITISLSTDSIGTEQGKVRVLKLIALNVKTIRYIGVGVTESGIAHNGKAMNDLAEMIHTAMQSGFKENYPISVINTDNIPNNGDSIRKYVEGCDFTQSELISRTRIGVPISVLVCVLFHFVNCNA